jgi:hypothetical protein
LNNYEHKEDVRGYLQFEMDEMKNSGTVKGEFE